MWKRACRKRQANSICVRHNRDILQANEYVHDLARSQTDCYAYTVLLHRVPIVLTFDLDADMTYADGSNWYQENARVLHVDARMYYDVPSTAVAHPPKPKRRRLA